MICINKNIFTNQDISNLGILGCLLIATIITHSITIVISGASACVIADYIVAECMLVAIM